jgi:Fanconi anemia group M protein
MAATDDPGYVDHPLLSPDFIERRRYQVQLASTAQERHTLVCLPTGLGKTTVSLLVTAHRLHEVGGKALFLAPTKPLVQQHAEFYREALEIPDEEIVVFTGEVSPEDRADLFDGARVVIATAQDGVLVVADRPGSHHPRPRHRRAPFRNRNGCNRVLLAVPVRE